MEERVISVQAKSDGRSITSARRPAVLAGAVAVATLRVTPSTLAGRRRDFGSLPLGGIRLFYSNILRKYSERGRRLS